jgi:hypothetical protein
MACCTPNEAQRLEADVSLGMLITESRAIKQIDNLRKSARSLELEGHHSLNKNSHLSRINRGSQTCAI